MNGSIKFFKIFVVEDDIWYREMISHHLTLNPDHIISKYSTASDCLKNMHKNPDLVTIDLSLPDLSGDILFQKIKDICPETSVIILSGQDDIGKAIQLIKRGVDDYLVKNEATLDLLWNSINKIGERRILKDEIRELKVKSEKSSKYDIDLIGQSECIKNVTILIERAARSNINVSITGDTGTGKEIVARCIHLKSSRKNKNFVPVNMAAIPSELLESELFGHEKGAFTGAIHRKIGKFEEANGGTLFLDEIAELDINMQSKILRVLQEREMTRVGGNNLIKLDIRLIVATHKILTDEIKNKSFREDLYFRIMGLTIHLPPLRDRGNDIVLLTEYYIDKYVKENNMAGITITQSAREKLLDYHFPGNIRELKAIIELAMVMCNHNRITADDIVLTTKNETIDNSREDKSLREHIHDIIQYQLSKNGNNVIETAKKLDIGKSTIYKMLKDGCIRIYFP